MVSADWGEGVKKRQKRPVKAFMQKWKRGMVVDCSWGEEVKGISRGWITYISKAVPKECSSRLDVADEEI